MKAIINTNIVMQDHIIPNGVIIIDGDRIVDFGRKLNTEGMEIIDAGGNFTGPGFVELHTHAACGTFITDDPAAAAKNLLGHGVTTSLAALYFSADCDTLVAQANKIKAVAGTDEAPNLLGLYMEAPYMNPKFGCNKENNPWRYPINKADYQPLIDAIGDFAKVWCLAPEREGIEEFVKDVKKINPDAVFTVAHSEATPQEIEALIPYGLKIATHHTNATGYLPKYPECRGLSVDDAAWYNDSIYTELICDKMGIHVDPYIIRLVRKIKGSEKIVLIADSFVDDGPIPSDGCYDGADDINFDHSGEISGTKLTLDAACRNMMFNGGASIPECFRYASTNPANALSMQEIGRIKKGALANLVIVDGLFNVQKVILRGEVQ